MKDFQWGISLGAMCLLLTSAAPAAAQQSPAPQAADATQADGSADIIVTAQKSSELLRNVPISIAVLGGQSLRDQGAAKLEDYVARVPGLFLNAGGLGQQQLAIRGVSTGPQYAPTVAVYIDEAPVGSSNGSGGGGLLTPDIDSLDLARVEVLRGPQGTLYGASNIGGLMKYVTVAPDLGAVHGAASVEGQSMTHGELGYALRGRISAPVVTDKLAVLASGYYREDPGFIDDSGRGAKNIDGTKVVGGRLALQFKPTEQTTIRIAATGQNRSADGFSQIDADTATLTPLYGKYEQRRAQGSEFLRTHVRVYYATLEHDMDWAKLSVTSSYNTLWNRSRNDLTSTFGPVLDYGIPNLGFAGAYAITQKKWTQEVRLSGGLGDNLDWTIGGFATREKSRTIVTVPTFNSLTGAPIVVADLLNSDSRGIYRETAGFGQLTYRFSPQFDVIVGGRYAHNRQTSNVTSSGDLIGPASTVLSKSKDSSATFTVSPRFKPNDHLTIYARAASGYRPGGSNDAFAPNPTYDPDRVTNYELGIKGSIPASRITFELSTFYIDWTKVQVQLLTDLGLGYIGNAGKASSRGVEFAGSIMPVSGLTLGVNGAYIDAHLDRDIPSGTAGFKGDALPYSPRWKFSLNADYRTKLSGDWSGFAGASYFYTDNVLGTFESDASTARVALPHYGTADLRAGVDNGRWTLSLIAKNMFDKLAYNGSGPTTLTVIRPRTILLSLKADY